MRGGFGLWAALLTLAPLSAAGHGGEPTITGLRFPAHRPGEVWAITDNQGLYAVVDGQTAWLCEDAVAPAAGITDIAALGDGRRWLLLTEEGLFASDDAGCSYRAAPADLTDQQIAALSAHPRRPREAVAISETFGVENDIWLTEDGGGTWRPAGLALRGRFLGLLRSEADPARLYAVHDRGGFTSADGGRTWDPIPLGPPELDALPSAVTLLAAPVGGRLFVAVELPTGLALALSEDAGRTWREVLRIDDFEVDLAFDGAGREGLLISAFDGARRTLDGGDTWVEAPLPVDRLQHIGRDPATGRLWGSTGLFFGGPFALGMSDDFGRAWQPVLTRFEDVQRRWDCPPDTPARRCCGTLCPGRPLDAMCPGQRPDEGDACAAEPGPPPTPLPTDGGPPGPDAALDMGLDPPDIGPRPDAAIDLDAAPDSGLDAAPPDQGSDVGAPVDRGPPDAGRDPTDSAVDVRFAPDVTVIPANPPADGCAQRPASPSTPWPALVAAWICLASRLGRRLGVRRPPSHRM